MCVVYYHGSSTQRQSMHKLAAGRAYHALQLARVYISMPFKKRQLWSVIPLGPLIDCRQVHVWQQDLCIHFNQAASRQALIK